MKKLCLKLVLPLLLCLQFLFPFSSFLIFSGCTDETPVSPPPTPPALKDTVTLSASYIGHRSITIDINTTNNNSGSRIKLFRTAEGAEINIAEYPITVSDTSITDDASGAGLKTDTEYRYFAVRYDSSGNAADTGNILTVKTLPVTTHDYTWEEIEIGDSGFPNELSDVWGIDENNVYAAGTVMINDIAYGILKWNGHEWIPEKKIGGVKSIWGFNSNDIWAVGEGAVEHYNGTSWKRIDAKISNSIIPLDSILFYNNPYAACWGTSSSNMYFGNNRGKIIHWDGKKAEVIYEADTETLITDIYGVGENFIIACGSALAPPNIILKYENFAWRRITELPDNNLVYSAYVVTPKEYYIAGEEVYRYTGSWETVMDDNPVILKIRGNKKTGEIAVSGHFAVLYHYNGIDWKKFQFSQTFYTPLNSVFLTEKKIFAVGAFGNRARIITGTKQN